MWNIVANKNKAYCVKAFVCDSLNDLTQIPIQNCSQGSTVFVIESSTTYILNGSRQWVVVSPSASASPSSQDDSEYTIVDGGTASN